MSISIMSAAIEFITQVNVMLEEHVFANLDKTTALNQLFVYFTNSFETVCT